MSDNTNSILIFTSIEKETSSWGEERGIDDTIKRAAAKVSEVTVNTLKDNFSDFLSNLDIILSASPKEVGGLILDEVEIHTQIDSKGNVGITGIAGVELTTQGGIKFVLRKKV